MIILDTNVISEPMKPFGSPKVLAWLDRQLAGTLYLTAVNLSELLCGIEKLPEGKRKKGLGEVFAELMTQLFGSRILPFDREAALAHAPLFRTAQTRGHNLSLADGQIAAIASVHSFIVATRDVEPFVAAGVPVIDPWSAD